MNKALVRGLVAVVCLSWALALLARGVKLPDGFYAAYPTAVTACSLAILAFDTWVWRWPLVVLMHRTPVLRGTWVGRFRRDLPAGQEAVAASGQVYLVIAQTFSSVQVRLFTPESSSLSLSCSVVTAQDGRMGLTWVYQNEPEYLQRQESEIHHGAAKVRLEGSPPTSLRGHYWTDRKPERTAGELEFHLLSRTVVDGHRQGEVLAATPQTPAEDAIP